MQVLQDLQSHLKVKEYPLRHLRTLIGCSCLRSAGCSSVPSGVRDARVACNVDGQKHNNACSPSHPLLLVTATVAGVQATCE